MKKKIILIITLIMILLIGLFLYIRNESTDKTDALKFKEEYESLNGKYDMKNRKYVGIKIDQNNPIKYAEYDEIIDILDNGTGIIYFGFPECPWCRNAVPVLLEAADELGIDTIYYYNALPIRDKKSLDEKGNIVVEEKGTKEYKKLVKLMYNELPVYEGLNDDTIKRLYFPTVVFVKEGKIMGLHVSTVPSQENPLKPLNRQQHNELKDIYSKYINDVYDILCDESC